jgi:hypothetical protein
VPPEEEHRLTVVKCLNAALTATGLAAIAQAPALAQVFLAASTAALAGELIRLPRR